MNKINWLVAAVFGVVVLLAFSCGRESTGWRLGDDGARG